MLKKSQKISSGKEYKKIYKKGRRTYGRHIIIFLLPNLIGENRYGVVASKKVGNAVIRNLSKRRVKAIISKNKAFIKKGNDIVITTRPGISEVPFENIEKDFMQAMRKAGLWVKKY